MEPLNAKIARALLLLRAWLVMIFLGVPLLAVGVLSLPQRQVTSAGRP